VYRDKRDALLAALDEEFTDLPGASWTRPGGGLYVWMTFPTGMNSGPGGSLLEAALREGVLYIPGEYGFIGENAGPPPRNGARLSFGVATPEKLREGARRLRRAAHTADAARHFGKERVPTPV
jgi:2-aminoadipate transaminase